MADKSTIKWLHQLLPTHSYGQEDGKCRRHVTVIGLSYTTHFILSVLLYIRKQAINHTLHLSHEVASISGTPQARITNPIYPFSVSEVFLNSLCHAEGLKLLKGWFNILL